MYSLTLEKCKKQNQQCLLRVCRPEVRHQSLSCLSESLRDESFAIPRLWQYWASLVSLDLQHTVLVSASAITPCFPVCLFVLYLPKLFSLYESAFKFLSFDKNTSKAPARLLVCSFLYSVYVRFGGSISPLPVDM